MSKPERSKPVKLFLSAIYSNPESLKRVLGKLEERLGEIDYSTKEMSFEHTNYYEPEMGAPLFRQFFSFGNLIQPESLVDIKLFTNQLELEENEEGRRRINLDPGYVGMNQMVLATGKPSAHRIYLREGIWADLHLIFQSGSFQALPWTYPDYRSEPLIQLFNRLRELLKSRLREKEGQKC